MSIRVVYSVINEAGVVLSMWIDKALVQQEVRRLTQAARDQKTYRYQEVSVEWQSQVYWTTKRKKNLDAKSA